MSLDFLKSPSPIHYIRSSTRALGFFCSPEFLSSTCGKSREFRLSQKSFAHSLHPVYARFLCSEFLDARFARSVSLFS